MLHKTWHISCGQCYSRCDQRRPSQLRATDRTTGMKVINYLSLDIFQRLQHWRTSEDVNDSSISRSRPWRKTAEKVSPNTRPLVSAWHTKMVAQTPHDTPTAKRQPCALLPDYQRRGLRRSELPPRKLQTARLLLVRPPDFVSARDRSRYRSSAKPSVCAY